MDIIDRDFKHLHNKLNGYDRIENKDVLANLKVGQHFRYTTNKYQEPGRHCKYGVVKSIDADGQIWINGFKMTETYPDWKLDLKSGLKQTTVYIKKVDDVPHNGKCSRCNGYVKFPYRVCYYCKWNSD